MNHRRILASLAAAYVALEVGLAVWVGVDWWRHVGRVRS